VNTNAAGYTAARSLFGQTAGIDASGAELVRYTMNAVYRIDPTGVVVRMSAGANATVRTTRVAEIAAACANLGLPTTRLAPDITQPVHADGWSATIWTLLPQPSGHRFAPVDLAAPLKALHAARDLPIALPKWDLLQKVRLRIAQVGSSDESLRLFMEHWAANAVGVPLKTLMHHLQLWCDELTTQLDGVEWTLPQALVHGDAHAGNLLYDTNGGVVIGDLDSVCIGPPEWDLIPAAHGMLRFGDDPGHYRAFSDAYGLDIVTCPAWDTLRQVRELQLVTSVIADLPGRPDVADQLAHRLRSVLADDRSVRWHRYR